MFFIDIGVSDKVKYPTDVSLDKNDDFTLLEWKLDAKMIDKIQEAKATSIEIGKLLVLKRKSFNLFGKTDLVRIRVNPDTFVQMAIQLAYMRLHKKSGISFIGMNICLTVYWWSIETLK